MHKKQWVKREESAFNLFLLGVVIVMLILSFNYRPKARKIPMLTGLGTLGLLVAVNVKSIKKKTRAGKDRTVEAHEAEDDEDARRRDRHARYAKKEAVIILWLIGLTAAMYLVGFLIAIPLYLFLFLFVYAKETWKVSLSMSVGVFAVIYVIFVKVLNVHVHAGILF